MPLNLVVNYLSKVSFVLFIVVTLWILFGWLMRPAHGSGSQWDPEDPLLKNETAFVKVDTIQLSEQQRTEVLSRLTNVIGTNVAADGAVELSQEAMQMQTRNFYIALLVALVGLPTLIGAKDFHERWPLLLAAIILTIVMYGLDVHQGDVTKRHSLAGALMKQTYHALTAVKPSDYSLRKFDDKNMPATLDSISRFGSRWRRQLTWAIYPDAFQIVIYLLPLAGLCLGLGMALRPQSNGQTNRSERSHSG